MAKVPTATVAYFRLGRSLGWRFKMILRFFRWMKTSRLLFAISFWLFSLLSDIVNAFTYVLPLCGIAYSFEYELHLWLIDEVPVIASLFFQNLFSKKEGEESIICY